MVDFCLRKAKMSQKKRKITKKVKKNVKSRVQSLEFYITENTDKRAIPAQTRDLGKVMLLSSRIISLVSAQSSVRSVQSVRSVNRGNCASPESLTDYQEQRLCDQIFVERGLTNALRGSISKEKSDL